MALTPIDDVHALQIQAGTLGRKAGHAFEDSICAEINALSYPLKVGDLASRHLFTGDPALLLLQYIGRQQNSQAVHAASALSTGALATSEEGRRWLTINGSNVSRCKSDIVITMSFDGVTKKTFGVSTKQCNNKTPTNAQLYFTTARGFAKLLTDNGIAVTPDAIKELRKFCGDSGYRPLDDPNVMVGRQVDPRRYFWEELCPGGRGEWERVLAELQDQVTCLLLQKAYIDDPFIPEFLIHKTRSTPCWNATEVAIYSIEELVALSRLYQGFATKAYSVRKGSHRDPPGVTHLAPRFGVIQMQRGGQAQHPEQLQFNLEAGYFYKLELRA